MRTLIAAVLIAAALPAAAAAQTISERQDSLFARIEAGVQDRTLTREEANRLRRDFGDIAELERQYRYDGLSPAERQDLNRRFDDLSRRIGQERTDSERVPQMLLDRRAQVDQSVRDGITGGGLSRREADEAYRELQAYDRQFNAYRREGDGISAREREELKARLEQAAQRILNLRRNGEKGDPRLR